MRWSDETVGRGDVCEQAFHSMCSFSIASPGEKEGQQPATPSSSKQTRSGAQRLLRRESNLDQMRLGRLRLRQRDRQHAEIVGCLDLLCIYRGRQSERQIEDALRTLIAIDLLLLLHR